MTTLTVLYTHPESVNIDDTIKSTKLFHMVPVPPNKFFESYMFTNHYPEITTDYIGHVSHSYLRKIPPLDLEILLEAHPVDIIALMPCNPGNKDMYAFAERWHPGFLKIWARLIDLLDYGDYTKLPQPHPFYCNYWIMKRKLYIKYARLAKRAMDLLESDAELRALVNENSSFGGTLDACSGGPLECCGKPYYTFHPFIMERLICFFAAVEKLNVHHISQEDINNIPHNTYVGSKEVEYQKRSKNGRAVLL